MAHHARNKAAEKQRPTSGTHPELSGLGRSALAYASRLGLAVTPLHWPIPANDGVACSCRKLGCSSQGKHPIVPNWPESSSTDREQIEAWWKKYPEANVGIVTGDKSGIVVLDIDPRNGGDDGLEDLLAEHGELPETPECLTGGGGQHFYFKFPDGDVTIKNRSGKNALVPGVELKADGGLVVAPPSRHKSGKAYAWEASSRPPVAGDEGEVAFAEVPPWLMKLIARSEGPAVQHLPTRADGREFAEGTRNESLTREAGKLRNLGHSEVVVRAALLKMNEAYCRPPLSEVEVVGIAKSISRYEPGKASREPQSKEDKRRPIRTATDWLTDLGADGGLRLSTTFSALDAATRGGIPAGRVVVVGGAPESSKTTLVVQLARQAALAGYPVALLAADEHALGLLCRWGQLEGLDRDALERGDVAAKAKLEAALEQLDHRPLVADGDEHSIEELVRELADVAGGEPAFLGIDSIQTACSFAADADDGPRARIDAVVAAAKRASRSHRFIVVATSELARSAYSGRGGTSPMSAFKESGGIEYGGDMLLVMRKQNDDTIAVTCPKSKLGSKPAFALRMDVGAARLTEVDAVGDRAGGADLEAERRIEAVLRAHPGLNGKEALRQKTRLSPRRLRCALNNMEDRVVNRGDERRPRLYLIEAAGVQKSPAATGSRSECA